MSCGCNKDEIVDEAGLIGLLKVALCDATDRTFIFPVREFIEHGKVIDFEEKLADLKTKYDDEYIIIDKEIGEGSCKYIESEEVGFIVSTKAKAYLMSNLTGDTLDKI